MMQNQALFNRMARLTIIAGFCAAVSGCGGGQLNSFDVGLVSVAPDGKAALILERSGDPPALNLLRLDLASVATTPVLAGINSNSFANLSPDGKSVLYRGVEGWQLIDLSSGEQTPVTGMNQDAQFLPDGEILVISVSEGRGDFSTVAATPNGLVTTPVLSDTRYMFGNLGNPALTAGLASYLPAIPRRANACGGAPHTDRRVWVTVNTSGSVSVLVATEDGITVQRLNPRLSSGVITMLEQQRQRLQPTITRLRSLWEAGAKEQFSRNAAARGEPFSEQEFNLQFEQLSQSIEWAILNSSMLALPSLDGNRLLFLQVEPQENLTPSSQPTSDAKYYLYLVDMRAQKDPFPISSDTTWVPSFAFSPDSRQIIFESNRDGDRALYLGNSDGSNIRSLGKSEQLIACWY